jgi:hypothetical protein
LPSQADLAQAPNKRNEFTIDFLGESEAAEIERRTQAVINN